MFEIVGSYVSSEMRFIVKFSKPEGAISLTYITKSCAIAQKSGGRVRSSASRPRRLPSCQTCLLLSSRQMTILSAFYILTLFSTLVSSDSTLPQWTSTPFYSPSFPLAVRSAYLNAWRPQGFGSGSISDSSPYTWEGGSVSLLRV